MIDAAAKNALTIVGVQSMQAMKLFFNGASSSPIEATVFIAIETENHEWLSCKRIEVIIRDVLGNIVAETRKVKTIADQPVRTEKLMVSIAPFIFSVAEKKTVEIDRL